MRKLAPRALWAAALACAAAPFAARAELVDRVAAVVNGDPIALSEVEQRAAPELAQMRVPLAERAKARDKVIHQALDAVIGDRLLDAQVKENGIEVSDQEVDAGIADVKKQNQVDDQQFEALLANEGFTPAKYREFMRQHMARMKLINAKVRTKVKISDEDVKAAYAAWAKDEGSDAEIHARHILVQVKPNASAEEVEKAHQKALEIAAQARKPGADFVELAKQKSEGPSAEDGGDLGFFRRGVMVPAFDNAAFKLRPGEVSDPVRTNFGWHVIKVEERRSVDVQSFDEVKDQLREKLAREQLDRLGNEYIAELRQQATVDVKI